jgi:dTDP-4-dehydrorhamnose reductase
MSGVWIVTGGTGQLATALAAASPGRVRVVGRPEFDFDQPETLDAVFSAEPPTLLINTAAWTAVDAAEAAPEAAHRANAAGPARLAAMCRRNGTKLIHLSTDYVFDGAKAAPYTEIDPTSPTGVYAESGRNFLRTMLGAARKTDRLRVVADQRGCPTNADDLAQAVLAVAARITSPSAPQGGIYHCAGSGETTWHGFAEAIFAAAGPLGWPVPQIDPITTADWPTPARRPADSRLDCTKLNAAFAVRLPDWQPSLQRAVAHVCAAEAVA